VTAAHLSDTFAAGCAGLAANANVTRLHDNEGIEEMLALVLHHLPNALDQSLTGIARESDQNDSSRVGVAHIDQPTKVFVLCQQDSFFSPGLFNQLAVVRTLRYLTYSQNIMALSAQSTHDGKVAAFVGQKTQDRGIHQAANKMMVS